MTEDSYPWPDNATGDGHTYTDDEWSDSWNAVLGFDRTLMAPLVGRRNELAPSGTTSPVSIATGEAIVDGKYYTSSGIETHVIATPAGGNSRIDLIVLEKDWSAQTVRQVVVAGTPGGSPSRPSLTQSDGSVWQVEIAEATINDAGVVTVVDNRRFVYSASSLLHELMSKGAPNDGDRLIADSSVIRDVRWQPQRFAWAFQIGVEGGGVLAGGEMAGPIRIPQGITSVTLDRITLSATVSGTVVLKLMSAGFSTSGIPGTEVSDSGDRPTITTAFASEMTSFGGSWDVVWASGAEFFPEVVGAATTIEQVTAILEGTIQP